MPSYTTNFKRNYLLVKLFVDSQCWVHGTIVVHPHSRDPILNEAVEQATKVIFLLLWKATWACLTHFREKGKAEAKLRDIQSE